MSWSAKAKAQAENTNSRTISSRSGRFAFVTSVNNRPGFRLMCCMCNHKNRKRLPNNKIMGKHGENLPRTSFQILSRDHRRRSDPMTIALTRAVSPFFSARYFFRVRKKGCPKNYHTCSMYTTQYIHTLKLFFML